MGFGYVSVNGIAALDNTFQNIYVDNIYGNTNNNLINVKSNTIFDSSPNSTQVQINNCVTQPALKILNKLNTNSEWICIQAGNLVDNNTIILGSLSGKALFGAHTKTLSSWADLYINQAGSVGLGNISTLGQELTVQSSIRSDNGSYYKGTKDMFGLYRELLAGSSVTTVSGGSYSTYMCFGYRGVSLDGNIVKMCVTTAPNPYTYNLKVINATSSAVLVEYTNITNSTNYLNLDLGSLSNIPTSSTTLLLQFSGSGPVFLGSWILYLDY